MKSKLKTVRPQNSAATYTRDNSMEITNSRDFFLYRNVRRTAIPQNNLLVEHLQDVGYITSWEEKTKIDFDPVLEKETSRKILKLRIKQKNRKIG